MLTFLRRDKHHLQWSSTVQNQLVVLVWSHQLSRSNWLIYVVNCFLHASLLKALQLDVNMTVMSTVTSTYQEPCHVLTGLLPKLLIKITAFSYFKLECLNIMLSVQFRFMLLVWEFSTLKQLAMKFLLTTTTAKKWGLVSVLYNLVKFLKIKITGFSIN